MASHKRKAVEAAAPSPKQAAFTPQQATPPRNGSRPIIPMQLSWQGQPEITVLALLDTGASCPLISAKFAQHHQTPAISRITPLPISTFDGVILSNAGKRYTQQLKLRHANHVTMEAFEIGPLDQSSDIILPHWWIVQHTPLGLTDSKGHISFTSPHCALTCTEQALSSFPIEYTDDILTPE